MKHKFIVQSSIRSRCVNILFYKVYFILRKTDLTFCCRNDTVKCFYITIFFNISQILQSSCQ